MIQSAIPAEVRERVIAAAVELYEQSGKATFPTVDAVRRAARVDMNAASAVMKEWRRAQTVQAAPVAATVPDVVQQASAAALAERAEARIAEIERRAEDLRAELDHAHADAERLRGELADVRKQATAEIEFATKGADAARAELAKAQARADTQSEAQAEQLSRAQAERDHAHRLAVEAREAAAKLGGQLEATQAQNAALLAALKPGKITDKTSAPAAEGEKAPRASRRTPK